MHEMDCSCAHILQFFSAASDGATTNRQIPDCIFGHFFTSLMKDSIANYGSILTPFPPSVTGLHVLYKALNVFRTSIGRWRHKIRKFVAEVFQNAKNRPQTVPNTSYVYYWDTY